MTMSLRFGLLGTQWLTSLSLLQCSITYTTFPSEFILRNWLCLGSLQLVRKRRERDGLGGDHILNHALPRILRLTIETNLMTSKYTYSWCIRVNSTQRRSASVGIISLLIIMIFPMSDSWELSVPVWSHINIAWELVPMPVRHRFCPNVFHLIIYVQRMAILGKL